MIDYYDLNSLPMTYEKWRAAFEDSAYRRIGFARVGWGPGKKYVSTVWLGLNHNFAHTGIPVIFESMVFQQGGRRRPGLGHAVTQVRYAFKEEAAEGHQQLVMFYTYNRAQRRRFGRRPVQGAAS